MPRKRKTARPADPAEIAHRRALERLRDQDPSQWGLGAESLAMAANADVVRLADPAGRQSRARRQDVFDLLHTRGKLKQDALNAVRRLQDDVAMLHRAPGGVAALSPRVDRSYNPRGVDDTRLRAGARIQAALELVGSSSARLLTALCETDVVLGRSVNWRAVVERETGEALPDAQGALLRVACENLAGAYARLDRALRPAPRVSSAQ